MSLKRSIRKKGSIEKKVDYHASTQMHTQSSKVRVTLAFIFFGNFFFYAPPPLYFFYNNMNDTAKCSLGSYQKIDFIYPFNTFFVNQKLICLRKLYTSHDIGRFLGQSVRNVGPFSLRLQGCS